MKRLRYLLAAGAAGLGLGFSLYAYRVMALEERDAPIAVLTIVDDADVKKAEETVEKKSDALPLPSLAPTNESIRDEFVLPGPTAESSPEAKKPKTENQLIAEARGFADYYVKAHDAEARADIKKNLREKLKAILVVQEARRATEIAAAEARLARMKEIAAKRKEAADSIVERRLEVMTGGVDELAWEEAQGASGEARKAVYYPATRPELPGPVNYPAPSTRPAVPSR